MNFIDFIKTVDDDSNKKGDQFEKLDEIDFIWKAVHGRDQYSK